jgi:eukaryotic-like serine/threonine-protein kinase
VRLTPGNRLGPYEVLSTLGAGGMAEVYRARDTRLGRDIALKVVNEALAGDPELVRRFEQEARVAGSLNHPNLVAVYDFGLHEGAPYFITELLKGESLRQRLSRGRIPVDSALDWGAQLAHGLAAAHAQGVVHRDVKPENVFVTSDGQVKLLDFGIAKLAEGSRAEGTHGILDETVTPTGGQTRTGQILGTPAYMSPEQIRGERVDARTDIFSLGAVLYELVSGQRPFPGGSMVESGHAILHDDPAPLPNVPPLVSQVIRRCLAKDPEARIQSAHDLAFALEMLRADAGPPRTPRKAGLRGLVERSWWALVLLAGVGAAIALTRLLPSPAPLLPASERVTLRPIDFSRTARFTPDGRVVFNARLAADDEIFERNLASSSIHALGLQNVDLAAVSSTNDFAVFRGLDRGPRTLARVPGGGGTPQPVAEKVVSADWSPSGALAVVRRIGPRSVVEYPPGKTLLEVTQPEWITDVRVSPRGDLLAFIHHPTGEYIGEAVVIDLGGKTRRASRRWHRIGGLAWAPGDEVWYSAGDPLSTSIQAMPLRGPERSIYSALSVIVLHDISADGRVLLGQGITERDITFLGEGAPNPRSLSWGERDHPARLSPDGRLALFSGWDPRTRMVAMLRKTNGALPQNLGEGYGFDLSPDGRTALLVSSEEVLTLAGTDTESRRNIRLPGFDIEAARFAGGTDRAISAARAKSDTGYRLYSVDLHSGAVLPVSEEGVDEDSLEVSPGAQWAATRMTVGGKQLPAIVSLSGAKPFTVSDLGPDLKPAGWASDDELWLARLDRADPSSFGLIRYDVRRRLARERRTIGSGGTGTVLWVHVTPDGKNIVFGQQRVTGHLFVVRGLQGRSQ